MMTIQITNALNYLGENQQGYDMLKVLEKKFIDRNNPSFKLELYGKPRSIFFRLGYFEEHIDLRFKALDAYEDAFEFFNHSVKWFLVKKDSYGAKLALMWQA
jgi:hypothetical protein